ncbi:CRISPR system precrRNA processing endoribonuclease RAMP protein Cas6 [Lactovum odontotermitis]
MRIFTLKLKNYIRPEHVSQLHGLLYKDVLPKQAADKWHGAEIPAIRQRLLDNGLTWQIVVLDEKLANDLLPRLGKLQYKNGFRLKGEGNQHYQVTDITSQKIQTLVPEPMGPAVELQIQTPMMFKNKGTYLRSFDTQKFFSSIIRTHDQFETRKIYAPANFQDIIKAVKVTNDATRPATTIVNQRQIPGFRGLIALEISADATLTQQIHYLLAYGSYVGSGGKTALGMGSYTISA